jgi:hypothetical protein
MAAISGRRTHVLQVTGGRQRCVQERQLHMSAVSERSTSTVVTQSVKQARAVETTGRDRQPQAETTYAGRVPLCSVRGDTPKASMQSMNLSALVLHDG